MLITSKENANIKLYKKLSGSKKARDESGKYALEGARLVAEAIFEGKAEKLFFTENALEKYYELFDASKIRNDENAYVISDDLSKLMCSTQTPQGIYCIAGKNENIFSSDMIKAFSSFLILDGLQDPGNIGTIMRTCDACGIDCVLLTENCCDIYNPKVIRSAMGSVFRMNIFNELSFETIVDIMKDNQIKTYASVIDNTACEIRDVEFKGKYAVVIGNEGNGINKKNISLCDEKLTIRMNGNINSLNAATAAAIIIWEMTK